MPEALIELFSEEIPARMQPKAREDLKSLVTNALVDAGVTYEWARTHSTPRRLMLALGGLPGAAPDRKEEKKGPRVGAPDKAIEGFLKSAGLDSVDQCEVQSDKKGDFYVAVIEQKGRPVPDLLAEIVPDAIRRFPWPKSMRWGDGDLRWVRPLHSIVCTFDGEVVPFEVDGVASGDKTRGHRFMAPDEITVRRLEDYEVSLDRAKVMVDPDVRMRTILADAKTLCEAQGLELVEDEALLEEVAGLVEWPVALMGEFDEAFLDVPPEVLTSTMRANQKYFAVRDPATDKMAPRFICVANVEAEDGGKAIAAGNGRVLRARFSDARFFWDEDRKRTLESRVDDLRQVVFHAKLGTVFDKVERVARLARELAPKVGADPGKAERAARLAKADLTTGMVYEFPELQGVMGRYYALHDGENAEVADAIRDHYAPQGPDDDVPTAPVSVAVALADKLDTLIAFWAIQDTPTGSKDPYALRRARLGLNRIVLENELRLKLAELYRLAWTYLVASFTASYRAFLGQTQLLPDHQRGLPKPGEKFPDWVSQDVEVELGNLPTDQDVTIFYSPVVEGTNVSSEAPTYYVSANSQVSVAQSEFGLNRLAVNLKDSGLRHDLIEAVRTYSEEEDLWLVVERVNALSDFLATDDGANLLAGYKRASNILRIEEKKDGKAFGGAANNQLFAEPAERDLAAAIDAASGTAREAVAREDFAAAMAAMAKLRGPVDQFFEHVTVNADDPALRENRLKLLSQIRAALHTVADFSRIEG